MAQRTLAEITGAPTADSDDSDDDSAPTTRTGLLDRVQEYAATVVADHFPAFPEANHGETFDRWIDALDTIQHCERFKMPK